MSDASRSGIVIPGYQPVEKVGSTPSYGIWIRALQTRMNRRVLLKVLPPGAGRLTEYFVREIALMVRLDGLGVLPVIDEGGAGEVRYLVLDEAGVSPLDESRKLDGAGWAQAATRIEAIYRRAEEQNLVLAPIAVSAFRCLPNGDAVIADLGWVVPFGEKLPNLDTIPADLKGAAVAAHNRTFLVASLENLARATRSSVPRGLRRALAPLQESVPPEEGLPKTPIVTAAQLSSRGVPIAVQILIGALIVAGGAYLASQWIRPPEPSPDVAGTDPGASDPTGESPEDAARRAEEARLAERAAWEATESRAERALLQVYDQPDPEGLLAMLSAREPLREALRTGVTEMIAEHQGTEAAGLAALILRSDWLRRRWIVATAWQPFREKIETALAEDRVTDADRAVTEARRELRNHPKVDDRTYSGDDWLAWAPLWTEARFRAGDADARDALWAFVHTSLAEAEVGLAELEGGAEPHTALEAWSEQVDERGRDARENLAARLESLVEERRFREALEAVNRTKAQLRLDDRSWADKLAVRIEAQGVRYIDAKQAILEAIGDVFASLQNREEVDWAASGRRLAGARPPEEFPNLVADFSAWASRFDRAARAAKALTEVSENRARAAQRDTYTIGTEALRGTIREVEPGNGFSLKIEGRRELRSIRFADLSLETLRSMESGRSDGDWYLFLFFIGDLERAIAGASALDPKPEWLTAAEKIERQRDSQRYDKLIELGGRAFAEKDFAKASEMVRTIVAEFPRERWADVRDAKFARWLDAHFDQQGPRTAFQGYREITWDPATRELMLDYDLADEAAKRDWTQVELERTHRVRFDKDGATVRGSAFLSPDGSTEIFEGKLSAEMRCEPLARAAPNLNLVIWAGRPKRNVPRGLLGGLGTYPTGMARVEYGDGSGKAVLLPANVLGRVDDLEQGDRAEHFLALDDEFKVSPRSRHVVALLDDGETVTLQRKSSSSFGKDGRSRTEWTGASLSPGERLGTVEIRTYGSAVEVQEIRVRGTLSRSWWGRWKKDQVDTLLR